MADPRHSKQLPVDGIHVVQAFEYANQATRLAATGFVPADIGRVARQLDDNSFYVLIDDSPATWKSISLDLTTTPPQPLGFPASAGTSDKASREDHVHEHGAVPGGTTHAVATGSVAGYMSAADKARFDVLLQVKDEGTSVATGQHTLNFLGSGVFASPGAPGEIDVTIPGSGTATITVKDEGGTLTPDKNTLNFVGPGIAATTDTNPSQANITVSTGTPVAVGDANAAGAADALVRSDHVHNAMYPVLVFGAGSVAATTTTRYLAPGFDAVTAPITAVQFRVPKAGTLRRLRVRHNGTAGNGNAIVYTVRVNSVASALTVSLASTAADGSDLVNTVAVAAGDLLDIEVTKAAGVGTSPSDVAASLEVFV